MNVYRDGREAIILHAMTLGPKFDRFREENPDGRPAADGRELLLREFGSDEALEAQTGKRQSELVREAVHLLLERNKLAS